MLSSAKLSIKNINNVSRQLLSQLNYLEEIQDNFQNQLQEKNSPSTTQSKKGVDSDNVLKSLTDLMSERHELMVNLFENNSSDELNMEHELLSEMMKLDSELMSKSQTYKQAIAEQVIKVKNSTKVTRFYQKY